MLLSIDRDIVLASASPRRAKLLRQIGLQFSVIPAHLDENHIQENIASPKNVALTLSVKKVEAVAKDLSNGFIIGADTVVSLQNKILDKPANEDEAVQVLSRLSGNVHHVITGVTLLLLPENKQITFSETTRVQFRKLSKAEIQVYIATGEPWDKAGAYGIQGEGALLVHSIDGDYNNVVGFPLTSFYKNAQRLLAEVS